MDTSTIENERSAAQAAQAARPREMPAGPMIGIGLMLDPELLARLDRLRACTGESRSRGKIIERALLGGGVAAMEAAHGTQIEAFAWLARNARAPWWVYAQAYAAAFSRQSFPPTVETLRDKVKGEPFRQAIGVELAKLQEQA